MESKVSLCQFPREIGLKRSLCFEQDSMKNYIKKLNGKSNLYTSLYSFQDRDRNASWKFDKDTAVIDRAWWDFDAGERGGIEEVKDDVRTLLSRLEGDVRVVATGRGFHIHQLFQRTVVGVSFHRHLARYQKQMAQGLNTLDGYGFPAKLTRIPNTYNVTRKRWAVVIPPKAIMEESFEIPKQPVKEWKKYCAFFGEPNQSDFDFVLWVHNNPEPKYELNEFNSEISFAGDVPIMPCLEREISKPNPQHKVRVALVQHMAQELRWFSDPKSLTQEQRNSIEDVIFNYIKSLNWRDFNEGKSRMGIRSNLDYDNAPSCRWFHMRGMCEAKCWRYDGTIGD